MKIRWLLQACLVLAVGVGLASCTKAEIEQAMNRPAEIILQSSPCTPAGIASTATPEFCVNVMEIQLTNHDTQADVGLTLVNRTGRRHFIYVSGMPSMIDSSGAKWIGRRHTGLGSGTHYPVPVEPNVETQGSITFYQSGQATTDLTFSMRGEIAIMQVDSRGQPIPFKIIATRGFNISGIRLPQPPPQSSAPTEQNQDTKLAQTSPQGVATATPKASASSQSTVSGAIAGTSGSGKPDSQKLASSNASSTSGQMAKAMDTPVGDAVTSKSGSISVARSGSGPDVIGLRIGMKPDEARAIFKARGFAISSSSCIVRDDSVGCSSRSSNRPIDDYGEYFRTLGFSLPGASPQNIAESKYLSQLYGFIRNLDGKGLNIMDEHKLTIVFGPEPGREEIVSIRREVQIEPDKKPTFDAFKKTLYEKYGPPNELIDNAPTLFRWRYDNNGKLRKPAPSTAYVYCPQPDGLSDTVITTSHIGNVAKLQELKQQLATCGATSIVVIVRLDGGGSDGPGSLVNGYTLQVLGLEATIRALDAANSIVGRALADASGAAIKKGQQQKVDF